MAYGQEGDRSAYPADADLSTTGQYRAVVRTATGIALAGAAVRIYGILQDDPRAGEAGTVKKRGTSKAIAGAAFAAGVSLTTDAAGRFVTAAVGNPIVARSEEPAGALGHITTVDILPAGGVA